jgi:hypothetical protein
MPKKTKGLFAALVFLTLLTITGVALASTVASTLFLPAVYKPPAVTPTPTVTPTATPEASVQITYIEADPSGPDLESEYVRIENKTGKDVEMTGWTLEKNTSKVFEFPDYTLRSGKKVDVYSRAENEDDPDDSSVLYWGLAGAIWDNISDCAYLYDEDGDLVDEFCYNRPK